jgi:dTDP-4-amino-4,6-dideoxygalactose transaminase
VNTPIPFLDLQTVHHQLEDELVAVFTAALRDASFVGGPMVGAFEAEFARCCDARHCVGVSNGTDALRFALQAVGVKPGDTVVTVPNTFIATTEAISQIGARPDFVDVDARSATLDADQLREYLDSRCSRDLQSGRLISNRTGGPVTAVVPVHLYGQMADMDAILQVAAAYDLLVVEDACQAHGAQYFSASEQRWRTAGSVGLAAAFSFYPGKNLGACGEAGAITTNDEAIAARCRLLRDHGQSRKYVHEIEGANGRLDAIQAGILLVKLRHLAAWNDQRRAAAREYDRLLAPLEEVVRIQVPDWSRPVYHLYVIGVEGRDALQRHLAEAGIGTGIHYPVPLHLSPAYRHLGFQHGDFPVAERAASQILSLPMFPGLTAEAQKCIADAIHAFCVEFVGKRSSAAV